MCSSDLPQKNHLKSIQNPISRVNLSAEHDGIFEKNQKNHKEPKTGEKSGKIRKKRIFFCFNPYKNAKNHKKNIVVIISDVKLLAENDPGDKIN